MHKQLLLFFAVVAVFFIELRAETDSSSQLEKQVLYYTDPFIDSVTYDSFSVQFAQALTQALSQIQLSAIQIDSFGISQRFAARSSVPTLYVTVSKSERVWGVEQREMSEGGRSVEIIVGMLNSPRPYLRDLSLVAQYPLVTMLWTEENRFTFISIMSQKIVENLRAGYLSYLVMESIPPQVQVSSDNGLRGMTPVEWVFTPTRVSVQAEKDGYLPFSTEVDLQNPGNHKLHIQLTERRFYHSNFMYGTIGFGLMALAGYGACNYYYDQYQSLGESDYYSHPENFSDTFNRAQQFERLAGACLGIASGFFLLSFWF